MRSIKRAETIRTTTIKDLSARRLFKDIPTRTLKEILSKWKINITHLESNGALRLQRDKTEYIYLILSGYLAVRVDSKITVGRGFLLGFLGPEQMIGEMKAISNESCRTSRTLIETHGPSLLMEIPTEALEWIADIDQLIYRNIAALLIEKACHERNRIEVMQTRQTYAQVVLTLLNFLDERGCEVSKEGGRTINGIIKQSDIAEYIGCERTSVARTLSELKKQRILDYPSRGRNAAPRITITNLRLLEEFAFDDLLPQNTTKIT